MNIHYRNYLKQMGVSFTSQKSDYKGSILNRTYDWLYREYGEALKEGEYFHIPSSMLLGIISKVKNPNISDEALENIVKSTLTPHSSAS